MPSVDFPLKRFSPPFCMAVWGLFMAGLLAHPVAAQQPPGEVSNKTAAASGVGMPGVVAVPGPAARGPVASGVTWRDGITDLAMGDGGETLAVGPNGLVLTVGAELRRVFPRTLIGERDFLSIAADGHGGFWLADRQGGLSYLDQQGQLSPATESGAEGAIFDLALLADGSLVGVGEFGTIVLLPAGATGWQVVTLPWEELLAKLQAVEGDVVPHLYGVCQAPDGAVYAAGEYGVVLEKLASEWRVSREPDSKGNLFACAAAASGHVLAVGQLGRSSLFGNGQWRDLGPAGDKDLFTVTWTGETFVAAGDNGVVTRLVGSAGSDPHWRKLALQKPPPRWFAAAQLVGEGDLLLAGSGGRTEHLTLP